MSEFKGFQILPPFKNDNSFEEFVTEYFNEIEATFSYTKYGRNGQHQSGIDIISYEKKTAIQCKLRNIDPHSDTLIRKGLVAELQKDFSSFLEYTINNKISIHKFIFVSTFKADTAIDDECIRLSEKNNINVEYWSWNKLILLAPPKVVTNYFKILMDEVNEYYQIRLYQNNSPIIEIEISLDDLDENVFLGKIQLPSHHIKRTFRKTPERDIYFWNSIESTVEIEELVSNSENGLVILGNPGSGKTTELKKIAVSLWKTHKNNGIIPFYKSLKNFNSNSTISNILPVKYEQIPSLLIILDGLDEVYDITDFSNKLRDFIEEHKKQSAQKTLKFIISCRTSIYNKIVKNLEGFKEAYLNPLADGTAIRYLKEKFDIDFINHHHDFNFWKNRDLLETPFYLELIGENYLETGRLEMSRSKLISQYIKHRLQHDEKNKFRNDLDNSNLHLQEAKILALAMETMQVASIEDSKARAFLMHTNNLAKNPFIEQSADKKWSFELKSIQEYFVANLLSKMEFNDLIDLILVDRNVKKIHPSWYNVTTLLLTIEFEERVTYDKLVTWLVENDVEMIFQADVELVSDKIRNDTLQSYFQHHCINKTLWINNENIVGKFGDTPSNIEYLFDKAFDKRLNARTRLSSIVLLEHMSLDTEVFSEKVEHLLLQIIDEYKIDEHHLFYITQKTLSLVNKIKKKKNADLIPVVLEFVNKYDYKEFVNKAIELINKKNFRTHTSFILHLFKKSINELPWNYNSKYGSVISTKEKIFDLFCQIDNTEVLVDVFDFVCQRLTNDKLRKANVKSFINYCSMSFNNVDSKEKKKIINIVIDIITSQKIYHIEELLLASFVKECAIESEIFEHLLLLETESNTNICFLEDILNKEHYNLISSSYNKGSLPVNFLIQLRNRLQYNNLAEAILFQNYLEESTSFVFSDRAENSNIDSQRLFNQGSSQREFNVKFELPLLIKQMKNIFKYYKSIDLSYEELDRFWDKYYKDYELQRKISEYAKRLLWEILKEDFKEGKKLNIKDLNQFLQKKELDRIEDIYQDLPKKEESILFISDTQKQELQSWLRKHQITVVKFLDAPEEGLSNTQSRTLTLFLNLLRHFKFSGFEDIFLLRLVDFVKYTDFDFDFIDEMLGTEIVSLKVLTELKLATSPNIKLQLLSYLKSKNIAFNLKHFELEQEVTIAIIDKNYDYARRIIKLFYLDNASFLKSIANLYTQKDDDYHFLTFIINNLFDLNEQEFIRDFITAHYHVLVDRKILEESVAIKYLIKANGTLGFDKIKAIIIATNSNAGDTYYNLECKNYSNSEAIETLLEITNHCLSLNNLDEIFNDWFKPTRMISEALISIGDKNGLEISERILKGIELITPFSDVKENNKFYHEGLKNDIRNVIYKHKSKPFSFNQARNFVKENEFIFY